MSSDLILRIRSALTDISTTKDCSDVLRTLLLDTPYNENSLLDLSKLLQDILVKWSSTSIGVDDKFRTGLLAAGVTSLMMRCMVDCQSGVDDGAKSKILKQLPYPLANIGSMLKDDPYLVLFIQHSIEFLAAFGSFSHFRTSEQFRKCFFQLLQSTTQLALKLRGDAKATQELKRKFSQCLTDITTTINIVIIPTCEQSDESRRYLAYFLDGVINYICKSEMYCADESLSVQLRFKLMATYFEYNISSIKMIDMTTRHLCLIGKNAGEIVGKNLVEAFKCFLTAWKEKLETSTTHIASLEECQRWVLWACEVSYRTDLLKLDAVFVNLKWEFVLWLIGRSMPKEEEDNTLSNKCNGWCILYCVTQLEKAAATFDQHLSDQSVHLQLTASIRNAIALLERFESTQTSLIISSGSTCVTGLEMLGRLPLSIMLFEAACANTSSSSSTSPHVRLCAKELSTIFADTKCSKIIAYIKQISSHPISMSSVMVTATSASGERNAEESKPAAPGSTGAGGPAASEQIVKMGGFIVRSCTNGLNRVNQSIGDSIYRLTVLPSASRCSLDLDVGDTKQSHELAIVSPVPAALIPASVRDWDDVGLLIRVQLAERALDMCSAMFEAMAQPGLWTGILPTVHFFFKSVTAAIAIIPTCCFQDAFVNSFVDFSVAIGEHIKLIAVKLKQPSILLPSSTTAATTVATIPSAGLSLSSGSDSVSVYSTEFTATYTTLAHSMGLKLLAVGAVEQSARVAAAALSVVESLLGLCIIGSTEQADWVAKLTHVLVRALVEHKHHSMDSSTALHKSVEVQRVLMGKFGSTVRSKLCTQLSCGGPVQGRQSAPMGATIQPSPTVTADSGRVDVVACLTQFIDECLCPTEAASASPSIETRAMLLYARSHLVWSYDTEFGPQSSSCQALVADLRALGARACGSAAAATVADIDLKGQSKKCDGSGKGSTAAAADAASAGKKERRRAAPPAAVATAACSTKDGDSPAIAAAAAFTSAQLGVALRVWVLLAGWHTAFSSTHAQSTPTSSTTTAIATATSQDLHGGVPAAAEVASGKIFEFDNIANDVAITKHLTRAVKVTSALMNATQEMVEADSRLGLMWLQTAPSDLKTLYHLLALYGRTKEQEIVLEAFTRLAPLMKCAAPASTSIEWIQVESELFALHVLYTSCTNLPFGTAALVGPESGDWYQKLISFAELCRERSNSNCNSNSGSHHEDVTVIQQNLPLPLPLSLSSVALNDEADALMHLLASSASPNSKSFAFSCNSNAIRAWVALLASKTFFCAHSDYQRSFQWAWRALTHLKAAVMFHSHAAAAAAASSSAGTGGHGPLNGTSPRSICQSTVLEAAVPHVEAIVMIADLYERSGFLENALAYLSEAVHISENVSPLLHRIVKLHSLRVWHRTASSKLTDTTQFLLVEASASDYSSGGSVAPSITAATREISRRIISSHLEKEQLNEENDCNAGDLDGRRKRGGYLEAKGPSLHFRHLHLYWTFDFEAKTCSCSPSSSLASSSSSSSAAAALSCSCSCFPAASSSHRHGNSTRLSCLNGPRSVPVLHGALSSPLRLLSGTTQDTYSFDLIRRSRRKFCVAMQSHSYPSQSTTQTPESTDTWTESVESSDVINSFQCFIHGAGSIGTAVECMLKKETDSEASKHSGLAQASQLLRLACAGDTISMELIKDSLVVLCRDVLGSRSYNTMERLNGVICFACMDVPSGNLVIGSYGHEDRPPVLVYLPVVQQLQQLLQDWDELMNRNVQQLRQTGDINVVMGWNNEDKRRWWRQREDVDREIVVLLKRLEDLLGPWKCLFVPRKIDPMPSTAILTTKTPETKSVSESEIMHVPSVVQATPVEAVPMAGARGRGKAAAKVGAGVGTKLKAIRTKVSPAAVACADAGAAATAATAATATGETEVTVETFSVCAKSLSEDANISSACTRWVEFILSALDSGAIAETEAADALAVIVTSELDGKAPTSSAQLAALVDEQVATILSYVRAQKSTYSTQQNNDIEFGTEVEVEFEVNAKGSTRRINTQTVPRFLAPTQTSSAKVLATRTPVPASSLSTAGKPSTTMTTVPSTSTIRAGKSTVSSSLRDAKIAPTAPAPLPPIAASSQFSLGVKELKEKSVVEIRKVLRELGLAADGKKELLVARYEQAKNAFEAACAKENTINVTLLSSQLPPPPPPPPPPSSCDTAAAVEYTPIPLYPPIPVESARSASLPSGPESAVSADDSTAQYTSVSSSGSTSPPIEQSDGAGAVTMPDSILRSKQMVSDGSGHSRPHVLLLLDEQLQRLPWENIPCLQGELCCRVPSFALLLHLIAQRRKSEIMESAASTSSSRAQAAPSEVDGVVIHKSTVGTESSKQHTKQQPNVSRVVMARKDAAGNGSHSVGQQSVLNDARHVNTHECDRPSISASISRSRTWFVVDPESNLALTRETMGAFLGPYADRWRWPGCVGEMPPAVLVKSRHEASDLFIYCGHGAGEKLLDSLKLRRLQPAPAAWLWGCSSGQLQVQGVHDPYGPALSYLLSGSSQVIANLWDVTDKDLDRLSMHCMAALLDDSNDAIAGEGDISSKPTPKKSVSAALAEARRVCKLQHAVGYAPVVYGIPTIIR